MSDLSTTTKESIQIPKFKNQYDNYIGGKWVPPVKGEYFENTSPVDGNSFTKVARSTQEDIDMAIDAAWEGFKSWKKASVTDRSNLLLKIADIMEQNLEVLARAETWDNGKAIRETMAADLPLAIDHFRYFAGVIRAEEGTASELDENTLSMNIQEPLGVVGQIIPWNFPILMATWKVAPALAAGNCVVLKPAEQTPVGILILIELLEDILPAGVLNVVNGFGAEAGKPFSDFRPDNFLFGRTDDAPPLAVVDWQTVTVGASVSDVAYLLGAAIDPARRREVEHDLLADYRGHLAGYGVDYPADLCWDEYATGSLHGVVVGILATLMASETERGNDLFALMLNRHAQHAIDVDALDRVAALD